MISLSTIVEQQISPFSQPFRPATQCKYLHQLAHIFMKIKQYNYSVSLLIRLDLRSSAARKERSCGLQLTKIYKFT